jgi:hypothetical protein
MRSNKKHFVAYTRISGILAIVILIYLSTNFTNIYSQMILMGLCFLFIILTMYAPIIYERISNIEKPDINVEEIFT